MKSLGMQALGLSSVLHAVLVLSPLGHPSPSQGDGDDAIAVDVAAADLLPPPLVATSEPAALPPADHAASGPPPTHAYSILPSHDRAPRDSQRVQAAAPRATATHFAPALAAPVVTANDDMPHFVIAVGATTADAYGAVSSSGSDLAEDASSKPIEEQTVDSPAGLLRGIAPTYPDAARSAGIEGDVRLELVVGVSGQVESARVVHGVEPQLDEAALRAVRRFRFAPATKAGRAVRVRMRWSMQFRLH